MRMETPLGRVRGLGSARTGAHHWWLERLSGAAVLILSVWLVVSLLRLPDLSHANLVAWLGTPLAAVPMLLFILTAFWHLAAGLRVVLEDYVHEDGAKLFWLVAINFASLFAAGICVFAVLRIALGGGAQ